jgi:2-methylisocitrate lyase-like PEP mutase family enzyme
MARAMNSLRALLQRSELIVAPGAYDGITARLVAQAGFPAVYMTGAGTAAAAGFPDYGLVTMTEMVENARRIAAVVDVPVIADADTGYGNELNVTRTVGEFERAGVAAIHLEDQEFPKRCGHLDDKRIIDRETFLSKIRAAVAARRNPEFVIIARTDARAVVDLDEAVTRANGALDAGADLAFVEAPQTLDEIAAIPKRVRGPCLLNWIAGGKTPVVDLLTVAQLGYRLVIAPGLLLSRVVSACESALATLRSEGVYPVRAGEPSVRALFERFGARDWDAVRDRAAQPASRADDADPPGRRRR